MVESTPYFSIIIPTYQRAKTLHSTLQSVQNQTYGHWECLVVDDGGNDDTSKLIDGLSDQRFRYFWKENGERGAARNFGINKAKGEYITFLDSDDKWYPYYLNEALCLIKNTPQGFLFHLAYEIKTPRGKVLQQINNRKGDLNKSLITGNHLSCIGVIGHASIFNHYQFKEDRILSRSEDYELWLRLASRYKIFYSNRISAALIQHEERSILTNNPAQLVQRVNTLIHYMEQDQQFLRFIGNQKSLFLAHRYLYLALHLAMGHFYRQSLKYWLKAIAINPLYFFHYKSWGLMKNLLVNLLIKGLRKKVKCFLFTFSV